MSPLKTPLGRARVALANAATLSLEPIATSRALHQFDIDVFHGRSILCFSRSLQLEQRSYTVAEPPSSVSSLASRLRSHPVVTGSLGIISQTMVLTPGTRKATITRSVP